MSSWIAQHGGSIVRVGPSKASITVAGVTVDIVTALANVRGVFVTNVLLEATVAGDVRLLIGGMGLARAVFNLSGSQTAHYPYPFFVPPGVAVQVDGSSGTARIHYELR